MFAICCKVKAKNKAKNGVFSEESLDVKHSSLEKNSDVDSLLYENEDYWEDETDGRVQALWIDISNTLKAKKKLIRIFTNDITIPKQH